MCTLKIVFYCFWACKIISFPHIVVIYMLVSGFLIICPYYCGICTGVIRVELVVLFSVFLIPGIILICSYGVYLVFWGVLLSHHLVLWWSWSVVCTWVTQTPVPMPLIFHVVLVPVSLPAVAGVSVFYLALLAWRLLPVVGLPLF